MRSASVLLLSTAALFQLVAAIPPACLLGALKSVKPKDTAIDGRANNLNSSQQQNLADVKTICKSHVSDVEGSIADMCGDNVKAALAAFADTCKEEGVSVCMW